MSDTERDVRAALKRLARKAHEAVEGRDSLDPEWRQVEEDRALLRRRLREGADWEGYPWTDEDVAYRLERAFQEGFRTYPQTEGQELPAWHNSKTKSFVDALTGQEGEREACESVGCFKDAGHDGPHAEKVPPSIPGDPNQTRADRMTIGEFMDWTPPMEGKPVDADADPAPEEGHCWHGPSDACDVTCTTNPAPEEEPDVSERLRGSAPLLGAYVKKAYDDGMAVGVDAHDYAETLRKLRDQIDGFLSALDRPAPEEEPDREEPYLLMKLGEAVEWHEGESDRVDDEVESDAHAATARRIRAAIREIDRLRSRPAPEDPDREADAIIATLKEQARFSEKEPYDTPPLSHHFLRNVVRLIDRLRSRPSSGDGGAPYILDTYEEAVSLTEARLRHYCGGEDWREVAEDIVDHLRAEQEHREDEPEGY